MNPTEIHLVAVHEGPAIPLRDVCQRYFGLTYVEACRYAALNELGVPTFRMRDSQRAPVMVRAKELAEYINRRADESAKQWERSQV